ncbi:MAG: hypothetical protein J6N81_06290 [Treponema sp.]|nr:hypothetical protein [Treponema sp.]
MAICKYCGKYVAESQARQARFSGIREYYHEQCYRASGQAARDANTENWYRTAKAGKSIRGILYFIFIAGLVYLLIDYFFPSLPSAASIFISFLCGILTALKPKLRNSKLPVLFPILVIVLYVLLKK